MLFPLKLDAFLGSVLGKIMGNNCLVYEVSKENLLREKHQKGILAENTLIFTIGCLK